MFSKECHFLTAVWGEWYVDTFLNLNIASLLAPDNFPYFADRIKSKYHIATRYSDASKLENSENIRALRTLMEVEVEALPDAAFGMAVETHTRIWHANVTRAKERNALFCPIPADMIWANVCFKTVANLLEKGKSSVYALFIRVVDETFREEVQRRTERLGQQWAAWPARELMQSIFRNIHPMHCAYLRDSEHFPFHPEYIYWPVKNEGLLMRSLATTVLLFDPRVHDVDSHFSLEHLKSADEIAFIDDSDLMCGASITPFAKDWNWYLERRKLDIDEIGAWWIVFDGAAHLDLARTNFRFHVGDCTESAWRRVEREADFIVNQSIIARGLIRMVRALRARKCLRAAELLSSAMHFGRLRRRWRWKGEVTAITPIDDAFDGHGKSLANLLSPDHKERLLKHVLSHVALGRIPSTGRGQLQTLSGRQLSFEHGATGLRVNGTKVIERAEIPRTGELIIVDRLPVPIEAT